MEKDFTPIGFILTSYPHLKLEGAFFGGRGVASQFRSV
jgi:hypothetical protein